MRGWLVALPLAVAACATLSGLDDLDVCDGSACVDAAADGSDANVAPDTPIANDGSADVVQDVAKNDGGLDAAIDTSAPITVPCGTTTCVLDGGTACCAVEAGAPYCWDPPDCVGFTILCTGKVQCPGEVCCATKVDMTPGTAECGTTHPVQLCNPNDAFPVCAGNKTCLKLANGPLAGFYACM